MSPKIAPKSRSLSSGRAAGFEACALWKMDAEGYYHTIGGVTALGKLGVHVLSLMQNVRLCQKQQWELCVWEWSTTQHTVKCIVWQRYAYCLLNRNKKDSRLICYCSRSSLLSFYLALLA